jgi:transcription elongation factor GreA
MNTRVFLEQEIEDLRHELSVVIPQEIQEALEQGDLRENTEYSAALSRQHFVSIRLEQLVRRLSAYNSIDTAIVPLNAVGMGSIVKLRNLDTNKIEYVKLIIGDISDEESDEYQEITLSSPFGQSLQNKKVKDEVSVPLPKGKALYRILDIKTIHDLD